MATLAQHTLGLGQHPALLVIDTTVGFTSPESPLGTQGAPAVANIARLIQAFRARGWPVVFTVNAYVSPDEAAVFRRKLPVLNELVDGGRWAAIDPALTVMPGDLVLRKTVPSAFFDSPLRARLREWGIDSTVLCGFSTSGCVRASAVDALQSDFMVTVVEDACGDRDTEAHRYNLRDLKLKTGDVLLTTEFLAGLPSVLPTV